MTDLRLLACLVLSCMVVGAYSAPMDKERVVLPAGVTSVLDDSPINAAATQALPQAWVTYGWAKHDDGHCSYKGYKSHYCPDKHMEWKKAPADHPAPCPPVVSTCIAQDNPCFILEGVPQACDALVNQCCPGFVCFLPDKRRRGPSKNRAVATTSAPTDPTPPPAPEPCGQIRLSTVTRVGANSLWARVTGQTGKINQENPTTPIRTQELDVGVCIPESDVDFRLRGRSTEEADW